MTLLSLGFLPIVCIEIAMKKNMLCLATTKGSRRQHSLIGILAGLVPLLVAISVLIPEWWHYYVPNQQIGDETVERLAKEPSEELFLQINPMTVLGLPAFEGGIGLLDATERLLRHDRLQLKGYPDLQVRLPFRPESLDTGLPSWQLYFASLTIPNMLLESYRLTRREEYFESAREDILAWAQYERGTNWPKGFLWNDHALAERAIVLARFWSVYRAHPHFNVADARLILGFVTRTAEMLAKPSHFTYATNHGVMQNLALLHIALAFPALPHVSELTDIAVVRLTQQMEFYVNDEGVVLEHSAGYHRFGLELIGMAIQYLSWLGRPVPREWLAKYESAKRFYGQLRRPDGSLPMFGNTGLPDDLSGPGPRIVHTDKGGRVVDRGFTNWRPKNSRALYPVAGYSVWWDGLAHWPRTDQLAQTVVAWSHFPGHGHKLADELSVLYWANGQSWWTNIGYWPYGVKGRNQATSWEGSNAPHFEGEGSHSVRTVHARYQGENGRMAVVDLERINADGYNVRRQIVGLEEGATIVIDSANDLAERRTRTIWRTQPNVQVKQGVAIGAYQLLADRGRSSLNAYFIGESKRFTAKVLRGTGIDGSIALEQVPAPTSAIAIDFPSDGTWSAAIWSLPDRVSATNNGARPAMKRWQDPEQWTLQLSIAGRILKIARKGRDIQLINGNRRESALLLEPIPNVAAKRAFIQQALDLAGRSYPKYRDLSDYRQRAALVLVGLFAIQVLLLTVAGRYLRPAPFRSIQFVSIFAWIGLGLWVHFVYFVV